MTEKAFNAPGLRPITPGSSDLNPKPAAIYPEADGTIDYVDSDGYTRTGFPVFAGITVHCQFKKITAATGAISGYYFEAAVS